MYRFCIEGTSHTALRQRMLSFRYHVRGRPYAGCVCISAPGNWDQESKISRKPEVSSLFLMNWFNSYNDSLFAEMTPTQHKGQFPCSGVIPWWACSSLMSAPLPAEAGCETCEQIVLLLVFIANAVTTLLQMFKDSFQVTVVGVL